MPPEYDVPLIHRRRSLAGILFPLGHSLLFPSRFLPKELEHAYLHRPLALPTEEGSLSSLPNNY